MACRPRVRVQPGRHTVEVVAPGFRPYRTEFTVDPTFSTRLRIALQPE
ncbi:MAG: PEGA domain-containing protein [Acidimicrobiia bacterium]